MNLFVERPRNGEQYFIPASWMHNLIQIITGFYRFSWNKKKCTSYRYCSSKFLRVQSDPKHTKYNFVTVSQWRPLTRQVSYEFVWTKDSLKLANDG